MGFCLGGGSRKVFLGGVGKRGVIGKDLFGEKGSLLHEERC